MGTPRAVDMFAGGGGTSEGARLAGVSVVWCGNHWPVAVRSHALNHPDAIHVCQDLQQFDFSTLPDHEILLASPCCYGHSSAAQGPRKRDPKIAARHDDARATAMAVLTAADATEPQAVIVENVPRFLAWRLYPTFEHGLTALGYHVQVVHSLASHHGVPQRRHRIFVVATRRPIDLRMTATSEPAFGPCIQWDEGRWRPVATATPSVRRRIERSRPRCGRRFLTQHTRDHMGTPLHEPIRTVTTKRQWAVVDGERYRSLTVRETARAMGFRDDYQLEGTATEQITQLGHAVPPPQARDVIARVVQEAVRC